jgi:hypothetical protein
MLNARENGFPRAVVLAPGNGRYQAQLESQAGQGARLPNRVQTQGIARRSLLAETAILRLA